MIFIADMSTLIHSFFHVRKDDDTVDVTTRVLEKLERVRNYYLSKPNFQDMKFIAVFDNPQKTFRHLLFDQYKANRTKHEDLPKILRDTRDAVVHDVDWIDIDAPYMLESDDTIASIATQYHGHVVIYSNDGDMNALLESGRVCIIKKANVDLDVNALIPEYFSHEMFIEKYNFDPSRWNEYQAMVGDESDNLKKTLSWQGCGEKKATEYINSHSGTPDLANLSNVKFNKTQTKSFPAFAANYDFHMKLLKLRTDVPWPKELADVQPDLFSRLKSDLQTDDAVIVDQIRRKYSEEATDDEKSVVRELCDARLSEISAETMPF